MRNGVTPTTDEYIKREAAINEFAAREDFYDAEWGNKRFTTSDVEEILKSIPAADVVPVVRGRWVQTGGKYSRHKTIDRRILTCSVCGNTLYMEGVNAGRGDANFCPNCGAKMDKDGD